METVTINKLELQDLLIEIIHIENEIDLFLGENAKMIRYSSEYYEAKSRFNKVFRKINKILENEK